MVANGQQISRHRGGVSGRNAFGIKYTSNRQGWTLPLMATVHRVLIDRSYIGNVWAQSAEVLQWTVAIKGVRKQHSTLFLSRSFSCSHPINSVKVPHVKTHIIFLSQRKWILKNS